MILKKVPGWMLLTPKAFIFDPDSPDPLDQLEPEMFQVSLSSLHLSSVSRFVIIRIVTKVAPDASSQVAAPCSRLRSVKLLRGYFPRCTIQLLQMSRNFQLLRETHLKFKKCQSLDIRGFQVKVVPVVVLISS